MKYKKLRNTLIAILTVVFAVSAFQIIKTTHDYKTADKANTELQERFVQEIQPTNEEEKIQIPISIDFDALKQENESLIDFSPTSMRSTLFRMRFSTNGRLSGCLQ